VLPLMISSNLVSSPNLKFAEGGEWKHGNQCFGEER
jgi:hypothetical protein